MINKSSCILILIIFIIVFSISGCIDPDDPLSVYKKIYDDTTNIQDGHSVGFELSSGEYKIKITSDEDINIEISALAISKTNIKSFNRSITLNTSSTLIITNPSLFYTGDSALVDITIEKKMFE